MKPRYIRITINDQEEMFTLIRFRILVILSLLIAVITLFWCVSSNEVKKIEIVESIAIAIFSIGFLSAYLVIRDTFFSSILFKYKKDLLKEYYDKIENKQVSEHEENIIYIAVQTKNGHLIGIIESLLYSFAIFIHSIALVGIILAIRSYVAVSSHPNKEESEFYIIGLLGSLLYAIIFTVIYIITLKTFFNFDIYSAFNKFIQLS